MIHGYCVSTYWPVPCPSRQCILEGLAALAVWQRYFDGAGWAVRGGRLGPVGSARIDSSGGAIHTVARCNAKSPISNRWPVIRRHEIRPPAEADRNRSSRKDASCGTRASAPMSRTQPRRKNLPMTTMRVRALPTAHFGTQTNKGCDSSHSPGRAALGIRHRVLRRKKGILRTVPSSSSEHSPTVLSTAPIAIVPQTPRLRSFDSSGWPLAFVAPPDCLA